MLTVTSPIRLNIDGLTREELEGHLRYTDRKVDFEIARLKAGADWFIRKNGREAWQEEIKKLQEARQKSLLFEDKDTGQLWTYTGLRQYLAVKFEDSLETKISYPKPALIPWESIPKHNPRPYQEEAADALVKTRHAAVEIGTGLGKSFIIALVLHRLGLPAVIMAPSRSIARQLYDDLTLWFGVRNVGLFGDGRKDYKKQFTVAISKSLVNVKEGSKEWEVFGAAQVFIADESHLCPAETLAGVCLGVLSRAPYRFFFSGTQLRNDGLDLLLEAITGPIVYRKTVKEGVDEGYLARPVFRVVQCRSDSKFESYDANEMSRKHVYYNPRVNALAADFANKSWGLMGLPVLIMVEEVEQIASLLPFLKFHTEFAHGPLSKDSKDKIPSQFWESDPKELVARFNRFEIPILVGTSCIGTGTDTKVAACVINLQGGKSEIKIRQVIGRGTRGGEKSEVFLPTGKKKLSSYFIDFDIENVPVIHRHAEVRQQIYNDVYGPVNYMRV